MSKSTDKFIKLEVSESVKAKMLDSYGMTIKQAIIHIRDIEGFENKKELIEPICKQWAESRTINKTGQIVGTDLFVYIGNSHIAFHSIATGDRICIFKMVCDNGYDTI